MFLFDEKRELSKRRTRDDGPPAGCRERRNTEDRRQTEIAEISLREWTRYFLKYQEYVAASASSRNATAKPRG